MRRQGARCEGEAVDDLWPPCELCAHYALTCEALEERAASVGAEGALAIASGEGMSIGSCWREIMAISSWREIPPLRFSVSKAYG